MALRIESYSVVLFYGQKLINCSFLLKFTIHEFCSMNEILQVLITEARELF